MIYISIRFGKKTQGLFSSLARFLRQSFGGFLFLRFCFFLACGPTWVSGIRGFGGLAGLFLFMIISFSRFQFFNLHFGSLKLCFTNLDLEIQDNLSLIFLYSLEISNLIYFSHFSAIPHHYGSYLKIQAQVCPMCQNSNFSSNLLWSSKRQDPFSYPFFRANVAKIISYVSLQSFSFALSI